MKISATSLTDIPELQLVLDQTELFPSEMLPQMVSGFLAEEPSEDVWLTCQLGDKAVGFCYAASEQFTDGTWNMLAIAVLPAKQGQGIGGALVKELESHLQKTGQRILIVDTSAADEFAQTREFYRKNDYVEDARIRDYWAAGDDKIIFWKSLV